MPWCGSMDNFWLWLAARVPKQLRYWCGIMLWVKATSGEHSADDVTAITMATVMKRNDY
jgi:hypothetical protein